MTHTAKDLSKVWNIPKSLIYVIKPTNGNKIPVGEKNNTHPKDIDQKEHKAKLPNLIQHKKNNIKTTDILDEYYAYSYYLKDSNIYVIDIDQDIDIEQIYEKIPLLSELPYLKGNTKGYHLYVDIPDCPLYTNQQDVFKSFCGDLIHNNNIWEKHDKEVFNWSDDIPTIEFADIAEYLKLEKMNIKGNEKEQTKPNSVQEPNYTLKDIRKLIRNIDAKYAQAFDDWSKIVWAIWNSTSKIGELSRATELIHKFSQKSADIYNKNDVDNFIKNNITKQDGYTYATLIHYYNQSCQINEDLKNQQKQEELQKKQEKQEEELQKKQEEERLELQRIQESIEQIKTLTFDEKLLDILPSYEEKKALLEKVAFKLEEPLKTIYYNGTLHDQASMRFILPHLVQLPTCRKPQNFINTWVNDIDARKYKKAECFPPPLVAPDNIYNTWEGFKCGDLTQEPEYRDTSAVWDLLKCLANYEDDCVHYLANTLAYWIQKPGLKTNVMIIFQGEQGAGKNLFFESLFETLLPKDKWLTAGTNLYERFNNRGEKWACIYDEMAHADNKHLNEEIKRAITEDMTTVERKGMTAYKVLNINHFIGFTNNDVPIKLQPNDRRFCVIKTSDKYVGNHKYWAKMATILKDKDIMTRFIWELSTVDISEFSPQNKLITQAYVDIQETFRPVIASWLEEFLNSDIFVDGARWNTTDLMSEYKKFCDLHGFKTDMLNSTNFSRDLNKYDGITKKRTNKSKGVVINKAEVIASMIKKKHIDPIVEQQDLTEETQEKPEETQDYELSKIRGARVKKFDKSNSIIYTVEDNQKIDWNII